MTVNTRKPSIVKNVLFLMVWFLLPCCGIAAEKDMNTGILYGDNHAFSFTAPHGWVLDNESGVKQGLHAVFYPAGETWKSATVIAYAKAATKDEVITDIPSLVQFNIEQFHKSGSPGYKSTFVRITKTVDEERNAHIFFFEGDARGNYEAAGYIEESKTINFFILSCRTENAFREALPAFEELVASYAYLTDKVEINSSPTEPCPQ